MLVPQPFRLNACLGCPPHVELALSLAAEFGPVDPLPIDRALNELAGSVNAEAGTPRSRLATVGELVDTSLQAEDDPQPELLLLDRALERRRGHPKLLAIVLAEVSIRRGWPAGVVGNDGRFLVASPDAEEPALLDPATGRLLEASRLTGPLRWRCAHEACSGLLDELREGSERRGDLAAAIHAAELQLVLPLDPESSERASMRVRALRARLN